MPKKRIEYIDAMRGFTMVFVIYSHVCVFCFDENLIAYNGILNLLRMPCFFFISGWLFYKIGRVWDTQTVKQVVSNKFMVQIIPTFIFLVLYGRSQFFSFLGALKGGYWFTFSLFIFFVLYILSSVAFRKCRHKDWWMLLPALILSFVASWYDVNYGRISNQLGWERLFLGFISFVTWRYYIFFLLGTLVKKHFDSFLQLTDRYEFILAVTITFIVIVILPRDGSFGWVYTRFLLSGLCGIVMIFTFFRKFASWFTKEQLIGRSLQYVGTRTLDIYLLHYFFLPESLLIYNRQLLAYDSKVMEVVVVMGEALVVLGVCLIVSSVIRLSPFLAHYLFGVQQK